MSILGPPASASYRANAGQYHLRRVWAAGSAAIGLAVIAGTFDSPRLWLIVALAALNAAHAAWRAKVPGRSAVDGVVLDAVLMLGALAVLQPPSTVMPVVLIYLLVPPALLLPARLSAWAIGGSVVAVSGIRWIFPTAQTRGVQTLAIVGVLAAAVLPAIVWSVGAVGEVISGRRKAEADLEHATSRFENLFDNSAVAMFRSTFDGTLIDANNALVGLLHAGDRETLEGISVFQFYVDPSPRPEMIEHLQEAGQVRGHETELSRFDGSIFIARLSATLVDHDGETVIEGIVEDVTGEKVAERRDLIASQVFDQLGSAVVIADADQRISFWNRRATEMFGIDGEDVVGKPAVDVLGGSDFDLVESVRHRVAEVGSWHGEVVKLRADGSELPCAVSIARLEDPDGARAGFALVYTDLTELQSARRYVRFQAAVLEHVQNAVIATDADGRVTYWNPAAEQLYGWAASEAVGSLVTDLTVPVTGRVAAEHVMQSLTRTGTWQGEFEVTRRDGSTFPALVTNAVLRDDGGETIGIVGVSADLTDLRGALERARESGELAQSVLESIQSPVAVIDHAGEIIHVNGAWMRYSMLNGGNLAKTGVGQNYIAVTERASSTLPEVQEVAEGIRAVLYRRRDSYSFEYPCHSPTDQRWFKMEAVPIPNVGAVISHHNVTADRVAREALEAVVAEKDGFLATVSHELRTPLTAVMGFAEHLRSGDADPAELSSLHDLIAEQAREIAELVDDLLMAGRLDTATITIRSEAVSAVDIAHQVIRPWGSGPVEVRVESTDEVPAAYADPLRLRQILRNLVSNAVRHGRGPVVVSIHSTGDRVDFEISDEGGGIPEGALADLFQPYSVIAHTDGQPGSVGLGLFVSKRLAELMEGSLDYRREDERTLFTLSLPAAI